MAFITTPPSNNKHKRTQECKKARRREFNKEGIYAGTKGVPPFFFLFLLTNGKGTLPTFLFNQIQHNWGGYDPFLPIFDVKGEGSTPLHLLSMCFDTIGEGATPSHPFQPLLTQMERVQPLSTCYWHNLMWLGWAQPLPTFFQSNSTQKGRVWPLPTCFNVIQHKQGECNPSPLFLTPFEVKKAGSTPLHLFSKGFECELRAFNPFPLVFKVFWTWTGRVQPFPSCFQPISRHEEGYGVGWFHHTCFWHVLTQLGWVQPHPTCFWHVLTQMWWVQPHPTHFQCVRVFQYTGTLNFMYNFYLIYNILIFWSNLTVTWMRDLTWVYWVQVASSGQVGCSNWHLDPIQTGHYQEAGGLSALCYHKLWESKVKKWSLSYKSLFLQFLNYDYF